MPTLAPVHVLPDDPGNRRHVLDIRGCWCRVRHVGVDALTGAPVVLHVAPPPPPPRLYHPLTAVDRALLAMRAFGDEE